MGKDLLITEKQLENLVGTLKNNHSEGSYMAKQQLFTIATLAYSMWEQMEENEQLEDWMESKIAQSEQSIISVVKNFFYDEYVDENQGMGKLDYNEIVIGK